MKPIQNQNAPLRGRRSVRGPAESGAAVLIALVVIVALSGLGVVALTASLTSSRSSGNATLMAQSRLAVPPAVAGSLRILDDLNFATALTSGFRMSREVAQGGLVLGGEETFPGAIFVTTESSLRGTVFGDATGGTDPVLGDATRDLNLRFRQQWPPVPVAGFEVGTFCRERIRIDGTVQVASRGAQQLAVPTGGSGGQPSPPPGEPDPAFVEGAELQARSLNRFNMLAFSPPVACEGY